jgi:protocatechuate 3,4-dioxygenase beta subunit
MTATPDPFAYAISLNLIRRNLDASQKSTIGLELRSIYERLAKERQKEATARGNKTRHGKESPVKENFPELTGQARDQAGKVVGVSGKLIDMAGKVAEHGIPELFQAVRDGKIKVSKAAKLADKPADEQKAATCGRTQTR